MINKTTIMFENKKIFFAMILIEVFLILSINSFIRNHNINCNSIGKNDFDKMLEYANSDILKKRICGLKKIKKHFSTFTKKQKLEFFEPILKNSYDDKSFYFWDYIETDGLTDANTRQYDNLVDEPFHIANELLDSEIIFYKKLKTEYHKELTRGNFRRIELLKLSIKALEKKMKKNEKTYI
jgi:hypothetical protein